jgi:hypothetical protein
LEVITEWPEHSPCNGSTGDLCGLVNHGQVNYRYADWTNASEQTVPVTKGSITLKPRGYPFKIITATKPVSSGDGSTKDAFSTKNTSDWGLDFGLITAGQ